MGLVTEIFSKASVKECIPLQPWQSTMSKRNGWMKYLIYSQIFLGGSHGGMPVRANRATQIHRAKACAAEFSNKHACLEAIEENTNPQVCVPSGGTGHRPVKTKTGIEGTFVQKINRRKQL